MRGVLAREYDIMQNPALGAYALWAFVAGFAKVNGPNSEATLWHLMPVLPLVFQDLSRTAILKRQLRSGLRAILERDPGVGLARDEAIFDLENRVRGMKSRTFRALNLAVAGGLLVVSDGKFLPKVGLKKPKDAFSETRDILKAADKLGIWARQMTIFEYLTVLGVEPQP